MKEAFVPQVVTGQPLASVDAELKMENLCIGGVRWWANGTMVPHKAFLDPRLSQAFKICARAKGVIVCASRHPPRRFGGLDALRFRGL